MRLAILSDIHGNLSALKAVVKDLEKRGVDHIVNLGDSLSGPLLPMETAAYLMAQPWTHLAGNHERQLFDAPERMMPSDRYAHSQLTPAVFEWMAALRPAQAFSDEVFLCHGTPRRDFEGFLETVEPGRIRPASAAEIEERLGDVAAQVVVCGHTHIPRVVRSRGRLLVNPGSVGHPAYEGSHPFPHVVETGAPDARYAVIEKRGSAWRAELVAVPYDHAPMARMAAARGRADWEAALRWGYLQHP
jgi:predicted phosphodiesterase